MLPSPAQNESCLEGIELLPMYGKVEKCKSQLDADKRFLERCDADQSDRKKMAIQMLDNGCMYLHRSDYDTAMKRINQAWLLDSTNVTIYISFMVLLDLTGKTDEAMDMLSLSLDKINAMSDPKIVNNQNPNKKMYREFLMSNIPFCYKKNKNPKLAKSFVTKISSSSLSKKEKNFLRKKLEAEIPELN